MNGTEKRRDYLDVLSVLACFMVLWDHVDGMFHTYSPGRTWFLSVIIHVAVNPAVPVFVMISGATLLGYRQRYTTKAFFRRRFTKIGIPFLFWTLVYLLLWIIRGKPVASIQEAINGCFVDHTYNQFFWFFPPLFGLYLAMPIFSAVDEQRKKTVYLYCMAGYLILGGLMPVLLKSLNLKMHTEYRFEVIGQFLFYALFGYYIDHYSIKKRTRIIIYAAGLISLVFNILYLIIVSSDIKAMAPELTSYTYTLTAMSLFTFVRYIPTDFTARAAKAVRPIRDVTFGIYLIQRLPIPLAEDIINARSPWYITLGIIPMFAICVILCKIIKKCPIIKHII